MTAPRPGALPLRESTDVTAERIGRFRDGSPHVRATRWRRFLAWLVDAVVMVLGLVVVLVILVGVDRAANVSDATMGLAMIAFVFVMPLLYGGLCFRDGRALGGVLTGTRLVRSADGGRIGGRAPWVMLARTFLPPPLLFVVLLIGALGGGGTAPGGSDVRVNVDTRATHRLRAAGMRTE